MAKAFQPNKRRLIAYCLIAVGIVCGIGAYVSHRHANIDSTNRLTKQHPTAGAPSATKPAPRSIDEYSVAPLKPKYINVSSVGLMKTRIIGLGLLSDGQIAAPSNLYDAGWYEQSAQPGQTGAMFIYGHVSSWQAKGSFYELKKLKAGDNITITRGDNTVYNYSVVTTKVYPVDAVDMQAVLSPINSGLPGLNLMTCTGQVIKGTSEFNQRLVVFASLRHS